MKHAKKKKTSRALLIFLLLFLAAGIFGFMYVSNAKNYNEAVDSDNTDPVAFTVNSGWGTESIANALKSAGLIEDSFKFRLKSKLLSYDGKYQAGDFVLSKSMGMDDIMIALQTARRDSVRITIPEGYTIVQIAEKLQQEGLVSKQEFYAALEEDCYDYSFVSELKPLYSDGTGELSPKANRFEGFLYPDTYDFYADSTPEEIIDKMLGQFERVCTKECSEIFSLNSSSEYDLREIVTIASLIEEECKTDSERPLIASVIYNRLDLGMKLQIDATVLYARGEWKDRVLYKDLEIDSPYNTYRIDGLPAGPISSPGIECIKAALSPADTEYLYYVVKYSGSSEHNFAKDYGSFEEYKSEYIDSID